MGYSRAEIRKEMIRREMARRGITPNDYQSSTPEQMESPVINDPMAMARTNIDKEYPNMPNWLKSALLKAAPKEDSPLLRSAATGVSNVTNYIPAAAGGLLEGAAFPIRGIAGLIPTKFTQRLANSPDLRGFFTKPETTGQLATQMSAGLVGAAPLFSKLLSGAKFAVNLTKMPKALKNASSLAAAGYVGTPGETSDRLIGSAIGLGGGAAAAALPALARGTSALKNKIPQLKNLESLKEQGVLSNAQYEKALAEEAALKEFAQQEGFGSNVNKMEYDLPEMREAQKGLQSEIKSIPEENLSNRLPPPTGEGLVPHAERIHNENINKASTHGKNLSGHLFEGENADVPIAEHVATKVKARKKEIGSIYDSIESDLENKNILIPRQQKLHDLEKEAKDFLAKSGHHFKSEEQHANSVNQLVEQMQARKGNDIVPAADILSNYRTMRHLSQKLRKKAYSRGVASDKDLHKSLLQEASDLESNANKLQELLEQQDLGENLKTLKEANSRWANEVAPLYKNSTYQTFINKGYGPSKDLIHNLRGNGPGQKILRDIIQSDEKMTRRILGQRYASSPEKIHIKDNLAQEFINALPAKSKRLIQSHANALKETAASKEAISRATTKAEELKTESNRINKGHKEAQDRQKILATKKAEYNAMQKKIEGLERYIPELKRKAKQTNLSLANKTELDSQIQNAQKDVDKLKKYAKRLLYGSILFALGKNSLSKVLNDF